MQVTKTAKQAAIAAAKVLARENTETLKSARRQLGVEGESQQSQKPKPEEKPAKAPDQVKLHHQSVRQMQALENELKDIKNLKIQKEIQQKQQEENLKVQKEAQLNQEQTPQVSSKKGRRMGNAIGKVKKTMTNLFRQQRNVEMRQPPSS